MREGLLTVYTQTTIVLSTEVPVSNQSLVHTRNTSTDFSPNSLRNISSMTQSFSSILHRGYKQHSIDTASITDTKNMAVSDAVERVFRELKRRTNQFSNCFSNAEAETAENWLQVFAFAWNQLI